MDNSNQWRKRMARGVMTLMFAAVPMQGMFAQVTLNTPNTTLGVVIKKIQAQSEFKFFYDDDLSDMRVKAINVKDAALEKVLAQLLKDKGVTFKVDDKVVYLKRAQLPPAADKARRGEKKDNRTHPRRERRAADRRECHDKRHHRPCRDRHGRKLHGDDRR